MKTIGIKKSWKSLLVMLLGVMMVFSLSACGGGDEEEAAADDNAAAYNAILEELDANAGDGSNGELVVAMSPDFAPMEFVDLSREGDAQYVGFDVLLAKYIANELNMTLVIQPMSFDAVQAAVQTGKVDLGISGFSWTEERAENYFITDWYEAGDNETEQVIIVPKDKENQLTKAEDFAGMKVGAQGASLQKMFVEEQLPDDVELVLYENLNDAAAALMTGKIDALAVAYGNGEAFISANPDDLAMSGFEFEVDDLYKNNVILLNKSDTEKGKAVNEALAKFKEEGLSDSWYQACENLAQIESIDENGYDDEGNKIEGEDAE